MGPDREEALTLELLAAIEARSNVTQRHLADRLGVALGLANSYLKRCVRKGLIKIQQAPANRYLYYLTPQGLAEKSRLTAQYLAASLDFYRRASDSMVGALETCAAAGASRVVFVGVSELAEIGSVRSHDFALQMLGTIDPDYGRELYLGRPLWPDIAAAPAFDAAILTALGASPDHLRSVAASGLGARLVVPGIVRQLLAADADSPRPDGA